MPRLPSLPSAARERVRRGGPLFLLQMVGAGMQPSSCVWVEGERTDGLVSVCRQPERPQPWYKARSEVDTAGQWWSGADARADHCVSIHCSDPGRSNCWAAEREAFMHKFLVFLVVAFNISIQTKTFLYENSLNYYHLKFGLTQASLIRIQICFLQILAAIELLTQLILVVGGDGQGWGLLLLKIFRTRT